VFVRVSGRLCVCACELACACVRARARVSEWVCSCVCEWVFVCACECVVVFVCVRVSGCVRVCERARVFERFSRSADPESWQVSGEMRPIHDMSLPSLTPHAQPLFPQSNDKGQHRRLLYGLLYIWKNVMAQDGGDDTRRRTEEQ
jgi:hypothetical protein